MKAFKLRLLPLLLLAVMLPGCRGIDKSAIKGPVANITQRHDKYVTNDTTVDPVDKAFHLAQSRSLVETVGAADKMIPAADIENSAKAVNARHDDYVTKDTSLEELEKQIYLRETKLFNAIIDEAGKPFK